jgi:hypothetical protein
MSRFAAFGVSVSNVQQQENPPPLGRRWPESVEIDGVTWFVCPLGGPDCGRVRGTIGTAWVRDTLAVHILLHHTKWR